MKFTKILSVVIAAVMCISAFTACTKAEALGGSMRDITTMELVNEMGVGINLGNTFESAGSWISPTGVTAYEQAWGSPIITREMITGYAECGFGVLRIPVAWSNMMGEDYTINATYLARVKQVVGWALEEDMYVILNIHWDGGWWTDFANDDKKAECMYKYERIWTQLTEAFNNDYGDKLMFESLNEEGGWESIWNRYSNQGDKEKSFNLLNEINQKFVDIVRASGGNNAERHLLIAGYNTDFDLTCDPLYKMPNDPMNRCAVSVHYYTPSTFAILEADADWGKARTEWGSEADFAELNKYMTMMKETYIDKGIPVIVGEFGCSTGNKTPEMVRLYLTSVCEAAYDNGLCPVLWDITDVFYNREEAKFIDPELLEGLMAVKE
ncbi:MAG: glycoside hydrolase family 5 protein [Oscillospiraceae bacterium]|nr:glycoside hydrolase family 5 protein [Oscillospiraceae bacterium]